jgi:hypothetical protein
MIKGRPPSFEKRSLIGHHHRPSAIGHHAFGCRLLSYRYVPGTKVVDTSTVCRLPKPADQSSTVDLDVPALCPFSK